MFGKKILLATCLSVFSIMMVFSAIRVSALTYSAGVKRGDWAIFGDVSFEWESNVPDAEPPPDMNASWADIKVLDVSDSNVTAQSTTIYKNGTERTDTYWGNIATGEGNITFMIIPSNMGPGDEIPGNFTFGPEVSFKASINGTVTRNYVGANREVNYVNITYPIIFDSTQYGTMNFTMRWDKTTGVLCEFIMIYASSFIQDSTNYYVNMQMHYRMTATNMWPAVFTVTDGFTFDVTMISNSTVSDFNFNEALKQISFNVTGPEGKAGFCNVSIPNGLLQGSPWTIIVNGTDWTSHCTITHTETHTIIYIPYTCSTNLIQIRGTWAIPEFTSTLILSLLAIITLLSAFLCKRQRKT